MLNDWLVVAIIAVLVYLFWDATAEPVTLDKSDKLDKLDGFSIPWLPNYCNLDDPLMKALSLALLDDASNVDAMLTQVDNAFAKIKNGYEKSFPILDKIIKVTAQQTSIYQNIAMSITAALNPRDMPRLDALKGEMVALIQEWDAKKEERAIPKKIEDDAEAAELIKTAIAEYNTIKIIARDMPYPSTRTAGILEQINDTMTCHLPVNIQLIKNKNDKYIADISKVINTADTYIQQSAGINRFNVKLAEIATAEQNRLNAFNNTMNMFPAPSQPDSSTGLSPFAIAGIVIGAVAAVGFVGGFYVAYHRTKNPDTEETPS